MDSENSDNNIEWKMGDILSTNNNGDIESLVEISGYNLNLECIVRYLISGETKTMSLSCLEDPLKYGIIVKKIKRKGIF